MHQKSTAMIVSYNWICEYLPVKVSVAEMSQILTDIGLEVEHESSLRDQIPYLRNVLVAQVLELSKHPDADRLQVATVDTGTEQVQIVCGAPNIRQGAKVALAQVGAQLRSIRGEELTIKKAKIRGVQSYGMICSQSELGIADSHEGIWILPEDAELGQPLAEYLDLAQADTQFTIGLTPNRTDAMSHIGVARNVAAYLSFHRNAEILVQIPELNFPRNIDGAQMTIDIRDQQACPRYMGLLLNSIRVAPSPVWLQDKLRSVGVKPINNVVDITNFVLKECGQPLHAFDRQKIHGDTIIVRRAAEKEKISTLDGVERSLSSEDLLICDDQRALCMAGVYGGADSGVTMDTTELFLESAYFDATTIRRTSMRHHLRTDAATRYEKGVDVSMLRYALHRASLLLMELADAELVGPVTDEYPHPMEQQQVDFDVKKISDIIGKSYEPSDVIRLLKSLDFDLLSENGNQVQMAVPFALADVRQEADIAEEVLRIDGLNNIPLPNEMHYAPSSQSDTTRTQIKHRIRRQLMDQGLQEIMTNSIVNSQKLNQNEGLVKLLNSLTVELDVMRPDLLHSGLEALSYNLNRQASDLQFFEIGRSYRDLGDHKYAEQEILAIWATGNQRPSQWHHPEREMDLYALRSILDALLRSLGISRSQIEPDPDPIYGPESFLISTQGQSIARIYSPDMKTLKKFDIKKKVWVLELQLSSLYSLVMRHTEYRPLNKYPQVRRDLAFSIDRDAAYAKISDCIDQLGIEILRDYHLFDLYQGDKIEQNKKSLALNFIFEKSTATLTQEEVDAAVAKIVKQLQQNLGAELRN